MSGEQDTTKIHAAQDAMETAKRAKDQIASGNIGTKDVSDALNRAQQGLENQAGNAPDSKSSKVLNDMAGLVNAAETVISEKDVADRIQRIAKEGQLAQQEQEHKAGGQGVKSDALKQVGQHAKVISDNFGPLFQLIMQSHEFRRLVVNFVKISQSVFLRHANDVTGGENIGKTIENKWMEGQNPAQIGKDLANKAIDNVQQAQPNLNNANYQADSSSALATKASNTANDIANKAKDGQLDLKVTDQELETLEDDALAIVSIVASDQRYHEGLNRLFAMAETLYGQLEPVQQKVEAVANQTHMQKMQQETKDLVAEFTGQESLNNFLDNARNLAKDLQNDQEANAYLRDVKAFIFDTKKPEQIRSEEFRKRARELIERGRKLFDNLQYKDSVKNFLNASDALLDNLKNDQTLQTLREKAGILVEDLTFEDAKGNRQIDTQVLGNIRKVIVPVLADALKYIPIPKISGSDDKSEYSVENVVLCGYDIIPDNVFVHLESDSWVSVRELETQKSRTRLVIQLRNLRTEVKDVKFSFRRKVFPQIEDSGRATIRVGGKGATLTITFHVEQKTGQKAAFSKGEVDFNLTDLEVDYDKTTLKHDVIVPMFTNLFKRDIVRNVEKFVEDNLGGVFQNIGEKLTDAIAPDNNNFTKQLDSMMNSVKGGEFGQTYQKRQEKLE